MNRMMTSPSIPDPVLADGRWVFPDGRSVPFVAGGDETATGADIAAAAAAAAAGTDASPPAVENAGGDTDPFDDDTVDTFDRAYVQKLRDEAAAARTKLREAEQVASRAKPLLDVGFDNLWVDLTSGSDDDRRNAFDYILSQSGVDPQKFLDAQPGGGVDDDEFADLTKDQVQELIAEALKTRDAEAQRQQQAAAERATWDAVSQILEADDDLKLLEVDGKPAPNPRAAMILAMAELSGTVNADTVKEAIETWRSEQADHDKQIAEQAVADYIAGKRTDAENSPTTPGAGEITNVPNKPAHLLTKQERLELIQASRGNTPAV